MHSDNYIVSIKLTFECLNIIFYAWLFVYFINNCILMIYMIKEIIVY